MDMMAAKDMAMSLSRLPCTHLDTSFRTIHTKISLPSLKFLLSIFYLVSKVAMLLLCITIPAYLLQPHTRQLLVIPTS